ncbi:MAG: site-specific DNA-methyltransferase [Spirochaetaceae bacterium]|nr:site-specific DNA-methyltransferase [Spirochaetaceae bacterium]
MAKRKQNRSVETITHDEASRTNIPTAEYQSVMEKADQSPVRVAYERRNRDLDPQLVWRGKDEQDWSDLVVQAPPLFIQEKVHPKVLIDDLLRRSKSGEQTAADQLDLFADFNGLPDDNARTEFYRHDANWSNRMILGDSLQVMASLAEREGLRGKVQCIYLDPPYGIKFNSNFQWSTTSRDVRDGKAEHITREPEQVKAFRDTWRDGIHSYLTYLRDRLTVARDLLTVSGSIFVQIGDENVHYVRALMDEVMGRENAVSQIAFRTTTGRAGSTLAGAVNYLLWYARDAENVKYRNLFADKKEAASTGVVYTRVRHDGTGVSRRLTTAESSDYGQIPDEFRLFRPDNLTSTRPAGMGDVREFRFRGSTYRPGKGTFKTNATGLSRLARADRIWPTAANTVQYVRLFDDFAAIPIANVWTDTGTGSFTDDKVYVVQTNAKVAERCLLMTTDPGDLVLDPTCGSGTTAYVAEQWGRRWITIDTSRVALALARSRVMGARYPYYLLADSEAGREKEAELAQTVASDSPTGGDIRQGFVYERVPHITLKSIANNAEVDVIWERRQETLEPLRTELNTALGRAWEEWEIPREPGDPWPDAAAAAWERLQTAQTDGAKTAAVRTLNGALGRNYTIAEVPDQPLDPWEADAADLHRRWWEARIARQKEIDESIAAKADYEYLYDKPYEDSGIVRVAGPFTVESLAPHRTLGVDENDELIDHLAESKIDYDVKQDFATTILEHLKTSGVQQAHKEDRISFTALTPWPGHRICAEGRYVEGDTDAGAERRAGVFVGPEFGTVSRPDLVEAVREAADADYDVLIACAFSYDAHASEFSKLGRIPVLKARMNADLHMAGDLKNTGKGNLFVIFGEPDIDILPVQSDGDQPGRIQVKVNGVDVFHPNTGEIRSDGPDGIACWFIDTDYNEESFFVRHAYFLGANDPYKALKTTLKAEIHRDAWETLHSDTSRPFDRPNSGRIAVKVINHLGDEVMKVFRV